ncbi:MAG: response regulator [Balneolales bacterium]|nr:response regulator [Balneolales bacterium]
MKFLYTFFLLIAGCALCDPVFAKSNQSDTPPDGYPFSVSFTRGADYFGTLQTWAITRDANGILLFGNTNFGIQQFDGTHWRNIPTPASSHALSFATDENGTIYAGTNTSFGRLIYDEAANYSFEPLTHLLPDSITSIQDFRFTAVNGAFVYFLSGDAGFRYDRNNGTIKPFLPTGNFSDVRQIGSQTWIHDSGRGLYYYDADGTLTNGGFPLITSSLYLLNLSGKPAALTPNGDLWILTGNDWHLSAQLQDFGNERFIGIGDVLVLHDGSIAVATSAGVFVFDAAGNQTYHFSDQNLLTANLSHRLYQDADGTLWVSGANGITAIEIGRPMRRFLGTQGLPESDLVTVTEFNQLVFAGTNNGLYKGEANRFSRIIEDQVIYAFHETPAGLLIATSRGLYVYDASGNITMLFDEGRVFSLAGSRKSASLFYFNALGDGLWAASLNADKTFSFTRIFPYENTIFTINEDRYGDIWLGTGRNGVIQLKVRRDQAGLPEVTAHRQFTAADGLPADSYNYTKQTPDDVGFITEDGFYRLNGERDAIIKDTRFGALFGEEGGFRVWPVTPGRDGNTWIARAALKIGKSTYNEATGLYDWHESEFTRMAVYRNVSAIHESANGRVYFQAFNRIGYFDPNIPNRPLPQFRTHITHVTASDSLVYQGWGRSENGSRPVMAYDSNNLRFNFGLISFLPADRNAYQYKLEGADTDWSDWTNELYVDYRNLREGTYTFRVRGRNLYYVPSEPASFTFTILPPWYRSLWAYLGYGIFFIGIVFGFSKWRTQQLLERQAELEEQVALRTEEVRQKSEQLEKLDKIKSTFFSNVSHEFRTPLTLIKGPTERLIADKTLPLQKRISEYERILENSNRLLSLIDQILNLSKMESGTYTLQLRRVELTALLRKIAGWYRELARRKGLEFHLQLHDEPFWIYADTELTELLFSNILSNAVKYTQDGSVALSCIITGETAEIRVKDTGIGIPAGEQQHIFDRYYRAKSGLLSTSGSGIGLNLVKYVAGLHGMEIALTSEEQAGTEVAIGCKTGLAHIKADYTVLEDDDSIQMHPQNTPPFEHRHLPFSGTESLPEANLSAVATIDESEDIPLLLLADDNHDIRAFIRSVLGNEYRYAECANGLELVAISKSLQPDIILSDVMMPGLDGISASRIIKEDPETAHIPIIMITAKGGNHNELTGLESGANDYITKPFSPEILRARVFGQLTLLMRLRNYYRQKLRLKPVPSASGTEAAAGAVTTKDTSAHQPDSMPDWQQKIDADLHNPDYSVQDMGATLAMSSSSLNRFIKKEAGCSPQEYIRRRRIELACASMKQQEGTISEIAYAVGFNSLSYFCRVFRQLKGVTPKQFIEGV